MSGCEQHQGVTLPDNGYAERSGFVETVLNTHTPGGARRSVSLSMTSAARAA